MWIERNSRKALFINRLLSLNQTVMILQGARQVGKTSFILNALKELKEYPQIKINALYGSSFTLNGVDYLGRDFFGQSETGEEFLKNIELQFGKLDHLEKCIIIFIDEVDRYPLIMESIQTLANFSDKLKCVFTGSNLEHITAKNAATGRKHYFDLYPITLEELVATSGEPELLRFWREVSLKDTVWSTWAHTKLMELTHTYIRLGGMPKILSLFLSSQHEINLIPDTIKDLTISIEENIKTVLGDKVQLYEYEDILRKLALLSQNTLKYSHLQVQHAGQKEAKKILAKTVGARVIHKIRLWESERDLSKYILFDCGIANYLMNGAHLLKNVIDQRNLSILYETFVGNELITSLVTRDDLFYWKSGNQAEVEFALRSPYLIGIDVKTRGGTNKSLNSFALFEPNATSIVKIDTAPGKVIKNYTASLPNYEGQRTISYLSIPHYLTARLLELVEEVQ